MRHPLAARLLVAARNSRSFHHRIMARFLERRGWVCFYLEEQARTCRDQGTCWLGLYEEGRKRDSGSVKQNLCTYCNQLDWTDARTTNGVTAYLCHSCRDAFDAGGGL